MLATDLGQLGLMCGQPRAAELAAEAIASLKEASWIENGTIPEECLCLLLQFQAFTLFLTPQEHCIASSLDYKYGDTLLDFFFLINHLFLILFLKLIINYRKCLVLATLLLSSANHMTSQCL